LGYFLKNFHKNFLFFATFFVKSPQPACFFSKALLNFSAFF
jgi:hypothetical protein